MGCLLDRILAPGALRVRFHPVYEIQAGSTATHYVECLISGPHGTTVEAPEILFEYARKMNREADVDRACVTSILRAAGRLPGELRVGVNVHATTLAMDPEFAVFLGDAASAAGIAVERLVVEVVEHTAPRDMSAFQNVLDGVRAVGARIAVDDVGRGQSNFMMILACKPDYFKIDRYFVHGSHADFHRQAVLASLVHLARPFGARVVAEGIELEADLEAVRAAGIDLVQGFLFGEPGPSAGLAAGARAGWPATAGSRRS